MTPWTKSNFLAANNLVIRDIAIVGVLVTAGVFAATLSSALGSMMGAPRILQAFARDEVFSIASFFSVGSGEANEPRRAIVFTFLIAQTCILLGDLNAIAPIITMAFMITYGTINIATFYESITQNPSYRPTFRYCHWSLSLLGALSCFLVMFLIDPFWAAISIVLMALLHRYIAFHEVEARWGDLQSGIAFERARKSLLRLEQQLYHPKNWRPIILALSGRAWTRPLLAQYGHWFSAGHGILSLGQVITGDINELVDRRSGQEGVLRKFIETEELEAFPAIVVSNSLSEGVESLVQCHGLGGLRPNTVLLGWPNEIERVPVFFENVQLISKLERSVLALRLPSANNKEKILQDAPQGTIDVWWRGMKNGELMLLLAHLLRQNPEWRSRQIRLLRVIASGAGSQEVTSHLTELTVQARIKAEVVTIVSDDVAEAIQQTSHAASLVIMGFESPESGEELKTYNALERIVGDLPRVLFVDSAGGMELES